MLHEILWQQNVRLAEVCLHHPFVRGLADGTLDPEAFRRYVAQDAFFLNAFARAYALAAARSQRHHAHVRVSAPAERDAGDVQVRVERGQGRISAGRAPSRECCAEIEPHQAPLEEQQPLARQRGFSRMRQRLQSACIWT